MLRDHDVALTIHDSDSGTTPIEITAGRTYVRLRRSSYSVQDRETWVARWAAWRAEETDVYAFVKHEDNPDAPAIAEKFLRAIGPDAVI